MPGTGRHPIGLRLLLAAADPLASTHLTQALAVSGFAVDAVHWGADLRRALAQGRHAGVLLCGNLPDLSIADALAALRAARDMGSAPAAIVLTGEIDTAARIGLLDAGADDHLTLPVEADEVAARVRAVMRRSTRARGAAAELVHGPLSLRPEVRSARWHGREVALTQTEFRLLETLLRRRHQPLSRATLEEQLYGWGEPTASNAVQVHVHHLRRKFDRRLILTLRGVGYQLGPADDLTWRSSPTPR